MKPYSAIAPNRRLIFEEQHQGLLVNCLVPSDRDISASSHSIETTGTPHAVTSASASDRSPLGHLDRPEPE
jgi:hypothetical protein